MIHEIAPRHFNNQYLACLPEAEDTVLVFRGENILRRAGDALSYPRREQLPSQAQDTFIYLFAIGEQRFFLLSADECFALPQDCCFAPVADLRNGLPLHLAFAGVVGHHLCRWYLARRYCGACGQKNVHDSVERMVCCPACGGREYPSIMPAVIVGVVRADSLLLTKYAGRANPRWALVAGFTEIGETPEETVRREVLEETGLRVGRITYYKSQPWPFSGSLLMGFYAEVEGPSQLALDGRELAEAEFFSRESINVPYEGKSLTNEMICCFKDLGPGPLLAGDPLRQMPYTPASGRD
ncbi:MAG: NAD(+) diphosphatase [Christensenellales bacterium]